MNKPLAGISMMPNQEFLKAVYPLFEQGEIDVLEWSFDTISSTAYKPEWLHLLLQEFSFHKRLIGHGVLFSLFEAGWTSRQINWINHLRQEVKKYSYNHITEHFGFMSSSDEDFHKGCPLPVPLNPKVLQIGVDRLKRIQEAAQLSVGIENLAFSFSEKEVKEQGEFLLKLIEPINGFIILDLHNLYCQAENFGLELMELVNLYPLNRVKEIHVSGGSWQQSVYADKGRIRRDTHDEKIPEEIFNILPTVLQKCPYVEYVIFERLGDSLNHQTDAEEFRTDFRRLKNLIEVTNISMQKKSWGNLAQPEKEPVEDMLFYEEQKALCRILSDTDSCRSVKKSLKLNYWDVETWDIAMLDTALQLVKKWK